MKEQADEPTVVPKNERICIKRFKVLVTTHNTLRTMLLFSHQPLALSDRGYRL